MTDDPIEAAAAENAERAPGTEPQPVWQLEADEANEADALEQALALAGEEEPPPAPPPIEANPADAAEQDLAVPLDEDDYR